MNEPDTILKDVDTLRSGPATSQAAVVQLQDVSLGFGNKKVLDRISLAVKSEERLVIIGQSGAGKTTILRLILGILQPDDGTVLVGQHNLSQVGTDELQKLRTRIGMVYQDAAL